MQACANIENEIRKEKRRQRQLSKTNTAVAVALVRRREHEANRERMRRQLEIDATKKMLKTRADTKADAEKAKALLHKRKADIAQLENLLESKQALKRFTPEALGQGHPKGGGASGRKMRHELLDRVARTGQGLSAAQKNDWPWFKQAWDQHMLDNEGAEWGGAFAGWMQRVLNDVATGQDTAMSKFVYNETRRCFDDQPALTA